LRPSKLSGKGRERGFEKGEQLLAQQRKKRRVLRDGTSQPGAQKAKAEDLPEIGWRETRGTGSTEDGDARPKRHTKPGGEVPQVRKVHRGRIAWGWYPGLNMGPSGE